MTTSTHDDEILGKAYDARLMRRLGHYLRPYWRQVALSFAAIIVGAASQLAQPYLMKVAIDRYIATGQLAPLDRLAALYFVILIVAFAADYLQTWTMQLTGQKLMFDVRMEVYAHLQRLDLKYYDRNPVGRLMTRVTSDVDVLNDLFTSGVVTVFGDVFTLVGIMGMMLWMNWRLALVAFSVLPLIFFVTQWFRRNVRDSYRTVRGLIARINAFLQENITGMSTVQLFRRERMNFARFDAIDKITMLQGQKHKVDEAKLQACVKAQDDKAVRASQSEGDKIGVSATPAMFVNGQKVDGAVPIDDLRAVLDRALTDAGVTPPEHKPAPDEKKTVPEKPSK